MKRVMFLCLTMALATVGNSQDNNSEISSEKGHYNFGFFFSASQSNLTYDSPIKPVPNSSLPELVNSPGFGLGLSLDLAATDRLGLRVNSGVSFNGGYISYNVLQDGQPAYAREELFLPVTLDAGLHATVALKKEGTSPYALLGATARLPIDESSDEANLTASNGFISADIGIGLNTPLKHFSLSPELRYSYAVQGMNHVLLEKKTYMHQISLIIGLKG